MFEPEHIKTVVERVMQADEEPLSKEMHEAIKRVSSVFPGSRIKIGGVWKKISPPRAAEGMRDLGVTGL